MGIGGGEGKKRAGERRAAQRHRRHRTAETAGRGSRRRERKQQGWTHALCLRDEGTGEGQRGPGGSGDMPYCTTPPPSPAATRRFLREVVVVVPPSRSYRVRPSPSRQWNRPSQCRHLNVPGQPPPPPPPIVCHGYRTVPLVTAVAAKEVAAMVEGCGVGRTRASPPPPPLGNIPRRPGLPPPQPSASMPGIDTGIDDQAEGDRGAAAKAPPHPAAADASVPVQGHGRDEREGAHPVSVT